MGALERSCVLEAYSRTQQAIVEEVAAIDEGLRRRVYNNFQKFWQECIDVSGGHIRDEVLKYILKYYNFMSFHQRAEFHHLSPLIFMTL